MSEKSDYSKEQSPQMFNAIADRYDLINRILSLGLDQSWRKTLNTFIPSKPDLRLLDLACGTGDVCISLVHGCKQIKQVIGIDPATGMLSIGREKVHQLGLSNKIDLRTGDAQDLDLPDEDMDVVTIAFGIRNVPNMRLGLMEMYRVLKKEGRLIILEFSKPQNPILAFGHWLYLNTFVPTVGFIFSGNISAYRYLSSTINTFPYGDQFCKILKQFGFRDVKAYPLVGGVATIYVADK